MTGSRILLTKISEILKFIIKMKSDNPLIERGVRKTDDYTLQNLQKSVPDEICSKNCAMHIVCLQWIFIGWKKQTRQSTSFHLNQQESKAPTCSLWESPVTQAL